MAARKPIHPEEKTKRAETKGAETEEKSPEGPNAQPPEPEDKRAPEAQNAGKTATQAAPKAKPNAELEELKATVKRLQEELDKRQPQIIQFVGDADKVTLRFQAEVADDNIAVFGPNGMYGQVTGKTGTVIVPKSEWSRFYEDSVRRMIDRRWLVVLSGLTDSERKLYHCDYREGEVLDEEAFHKLLDMGRDLLGLFPHLCPSHQEMVSRRFRDAWDAGDSRANDRDLVVALNELSKAGTQDLPKGDGRRKGLFAPIIEAMNARDSAE